MSKEPTNATAAPRASISDVAVAAGVSRAAVSKVIRDAYGVSPAMRERVEAAIKELDYRPRIAARAMRGATFTIGFEVPHMASDIYTQVMEGAGRRLAGSPYQMILAPGLGYRSGTAVLESLVDRQVDGIIAISSNVPAEDLERIAERVPLALLGRHDESPAYDCVTGDDRAGTHLMMDHLLGLGHRRIAHVTIEPPSLHAPHAIRRDVYTDRMTQEGLSPDLTYVGASEAETAEAVQATRALIHRPDRPTAIFAGHDTLAMGCLQARVDSGLTADDLTVVGYDNIRLARHPLISLTTVDQFGTELGAVAIEFLMERIREGRRSARNHQTAPVLRVRATSRPPRITGS